MSSKIVAERYAKGLYLAIGKKNFSNIREQFESFVKFYRENKELQEFFLNMFYTKNQKIEVIEKICDSAKFDDKLKRFLVLLVKKRRISIVEVIYEEFIKVWHRDNNIYTIEVISAKSLNEKEKKSIKEAFSKKFGGKIEAKFYEDSSLIGGVLVRVGSTYYDGSVKGAIEKLKETIIKEM